MHPAVLSYCIEVKARFPDHFYRINALDCGSLDINGNNRYLFEGGRYTGIDVGKGRNVDHVSLIHEWRGCGYFTIISTECFEHDAHLQKSLARIVEMLRPGGLFLFTCATTGRGEHGTPAHSPGDAPLVPWDHYENVTQEMVEPHVKDFECYEFSTIERPHDLRFWGIK